MSCCPLSDNEEKMRAFSKVSEDTLVVEFLPQKLSMSALVDISMASQKNQK